VTDRRDDYPYRLRLQTRWRDNDIYGHVNNVVFYSYFDTVINRYLIDAGGLDIHTGPVIGIAAESACHFHAPVAFPDAIDAGLRVGNLGRSSVRYEIALFGAAMEAPAATGSFVHVFVDRDSNTPTPIPEPIRAALERLIATAD